jgi:hypothetical protein
MATFHFLFPRGKPIGFQKFPGFFLDDPIQTPSRQGAGLDQRSMVQTWLGDLEEIATTSPRRFSVDEKAMAMTNKT